MMVTNVEINAPLKVVPGRRMLCWANVTLDNELVIKGIRVYESNNAGEMRKWIRLPERQIPFSITGGEIHNIPVVTTIKKELLAEITSAIFDEWDNDRRNPNNRDGGSSN